MTEGKEVKRMKKEITTSSLRRFRIADEHLITEDLIKTEIIRAFSENRCFEFFPDKNVIDILKNDKPVESLRSIYGDMLNGIYDKISKGDQNMKGLLMNDARLSSRLIAAMKFFHRASIADELVNITNRRIVIVKELPDIPTLYHISDETTVISRVGQGPEWTEIPTIYLGLKIFDTLTFEEKRGESKLFLAFRNLLIVEERAIETGFNHTTIYPPEITRSIISLVDEVIKKTTQFEVEIPEERIEKPIKKFTSKQRNSIIKLLNARPKENEMMFDFEKSLKAVNSLESYSRRYKKSGDYDSLREVVRLLVAASGHDIHEVRNRANILLEKVLAPKEFNAPLATKFFNLKTGETFNFEFPIKKSKRPLLLRIYRNTSKKNLSLEKDIKYEEIPLKYNSKNNCYTASYRFQEYGHYDYAVIKQRSSSIEWINKEGTNGRINVIPDLRGEIILEIFTDIHGHTKTWWKDSTGNPGLLYNEYGEVIRLGNFEDVSVHLEDIKSKYNITAIYLLGVQKRGENRENWAQGASSPSPFSPLSLVEIEPSLGGEKKLKELTKKAHSLNIKVIVDIVPHINRMSDHLPDELVVKTYGDDGNLYPRSSTDGRYGSWDDGKLLNYRKLEIWEWLADSIRTLIEKFDIDGIRFDSAHAVPIMMKKNNYPFIFNRKRSEESMVEGEIIVNDREYEHFMTTGYYDSACRDQIAVPLHYYLMLNVERKLRETKKDFFINIAECYWGHERFLTRTGLIPYNSSLFKICENIIHMKSDVREIYHLYDNYFPSVLPRGTELLGILGNHDERRALNTFGHRGLRAAVALTSFMSNIIMDYEGSPEGEGWKVFLDNIYVNWNQFEYASHRSLEGFYSEWYTFHRKAKGKGHLVWANNNMVAAALLFTGKDLLLGAFNFSDSNQPVSIQFDNPTLPIRDDEYYRVVDLVYSDITQQYSYYKGSELRISRLNTVVSYTERIKLFKLEKVNSEENYSLFIKDSFERLCDISDVDKIFSNFSFSEFAACSKDFKKLIPLIIKHLVPEYWENKRERLEHGLKRIAFFLHKNEILNDTEILDYAGKLLNHSNEIISQLGKSLMYHNAKGSIVFLSAEAEPFSKSGGLANVVYELPRELVKLREKVYVITAYYKNGSEKVIEKMNSAVEQYGIKYTGKTVKFNIMHFEYEVGVHHGVVDGIEYYLLDHFEFFDGLYWGYTSSEKLKRRIAFARASAEVIIQFNLEPHYTLTNDAFAGIFNGIIKSDSYYYNNPNFSRNTFLHIIHNGGWQYFDSYHRWENGFDLFNLFNLPAWCAGGFTDPVFGDRLNCMATGVRHADRTITVSPSYAKQIEFACDGLEHILSNVIGISNAIGHDFREKLDLRFKKSGFVDNRYPELVEYIKGSDKLLEKVENRYPEILKSQKSISSIEDSTRRYIVTRMMNKLMLQHERGLEVNPDRVLFCMIHRISEQKGFQLLLDSSEGIFKNLGFQAIIGGAISSGDTRGEELTHGLYLLSQFYREDVDVSIGFQDVAVPLLSSDVFGMPSMHEPGGISQIEAFSAGCLVVARATGGLRDTVSPIQISDEGVKGNGFLFSDFTPWAFYDAMERAHQFFTRNSEEEIYRARINAENSIYFWDTPARKYISEIYKLAEKIRILQE
jgi:starch synthase